MVRVVLPSLATLAMLTTIATLPMFAMLPMFATVGMVLGVRAMVGDTMMASFHCRRLERSLTQKQLRGQELITETTEEPIVEVHWNLKDMLCNHLTMYNGLTRL
ncbi:hypothetical protein AOLI_G00094100 [Acnodon oligacanthus]